MPDENLPPAGPIATAIPTMYINVTVNGQGTVYDVESARALHLELGLALAVLDAPPAPPAPPPLAPVPPSGI